MNERSTNEPTPLSAALDQIAAGAARTHDARSATGAGIDVTAARAAARRGRTRYGAVTGLAAAAVVAAVALGGSALLRDDRPVPPVDSPTDTPTTTSTPSPTDDAWPSAVTLDGAVPACGEPMPALVAPDGEPEITIEPVLPEGPLRAGGVADIGVTITGPTGFVLNATTGTAVLVRDGVVVATEHPLDSDSGATYTTDNGVLSKTLPALDVVRCETHGGGAVPLDAGTYDLYVLQQLVAGDLELLRPDENIWLADGPISLYVETQDPHPDLSALTVTTTGLGPLRVGVPVESNPGAAMITYDEDYCVEQVGQLGEEWDPARGPAGEWLAAGYDPAPALDGELSPPFAVAVGDDGVLTQIAVLATQLRTPEGIGIGSTRAELLATYTNLEPLTPEGGFSQLWLLGGVTGDLIVETGDPNYTETTDDDDVVGITIAAPGYGQATAWGSGMMPGNCGLS